MQTTENNTQSPIRRCPRQSTISLIILLILLTIAAAIYRQQSRYDRWLFALDPNLLDTAAGSATTTPGVALNALRQTCQASSWAAGPIESFDPDNVYEKINGKDQTFFSFGFSALHVVTLSSPAQPDHSFEVFVYDMAEPHNAFGIFSHLRTDDPPWSQPDVLGLAAANAVFFIKGQYYLSLIGSDTAEPLMTSLHATARNLLQLLPGSSKTPSVCDVFPTTDLLAHGIGYNPSNFLATDFLDKVFTASYHIGPTELTCYLSDRQTSPASAHTLEKLSQFWSAAQAETIADQSSGSAGMLIVKLFDTYEIAFATGRFLGGITEAQDLQAARSLAQQLAQAAQKYQESSGDLN